MVNCGVLTAADMMAAAPLFLWIEVTSKVFMDFLPPTLPMVTKEMKRGMWYFPANPSSGMGTRRVLFIVYFCKMRFWIIAGGEEEGGRHRGATKG